MNSDITTKWPIVHIHTTYNNTIVSFSDAEGKVLSSSSGGNAGFKGARRNTAYAAQCAAELAAKKYFKVLTGITASKLNEPRSTTPQRTKVNSSTQASAQANVQANAPANAQANDSAIVVKLCGFGKGREAALRGLITSGLKINKIMDVTPIAHNGCKPPKKRRL